MKVLRQAVIGMIAGRSPGRAPESWRGTGLILHGYVRLLASELVVGGHSGTY
jgi:hypothetical protein